MNLRLAILFSFVCAFANLLQGQDQDSPNPTQAFYRGYELFAQRDFSAAVTAFESALTSGEESTALHFNLGTAAIYAGDIGKAVFHLRCAEKLAPRDEDIRRNLDVARSRKRDEVSHDETVPFVASLLYLHEKTTLFEAIWIFALFFLAGMLLLHLKIFRPSSWLNRLAFGALLIAVVMAISLALRLQDHGELREAVVLKPEVGVLNFPSDANFSVHFKLHAGAEVEVLGVKNDWVNVAVSGKKGWLPKNQLGLLRS